MNEVSARAFGSFLRALEAKRVPLEQIVADTTLTPADLRNKKKRIDWADFVAVMRNLRKHFSDDEYIEIGRSYYRAPALRFAFVVARMLLTPMDFYRWANKPRDGIGNQMFTPIQPHQRDVSDHEIEVDLVLRDGYEMCWDFFIVSIGNFEEMPVLLGAPRASVAISPLPNGARYRIVVPKRTALVTKVRRALTCPFTAASAARELKEAHETLLERYQELETARSALHRQATHLRIANEVSSLVQRDLDLKVTVESAVAALVSEAGFASAHIIVDHEGEAISAERGQHAARELARDLTGQGGQRMGKLVVTCSEPEVDERAALLAFVTPMVAMAVHNAVSYHSLQLYRANLERLVDERTADLRAARDDLAATVVQLREVQGSRDAFFANISHEIRTPLSLIVLAAGDVEQALGLALDPRARGNLMSITSGARKLLRLVDELLLLAAGEETKLRLRHEVVDVGQMIANLVTTWRPAAESAGVGLEVHAPSSSRAFLDEVALDRIITNLVSNAVKFTPRGGRISVSLIEREDELEIRVRDTGIGVSDELAPRLFGRFERGLSNNRKGGTGIGLSLVKQLCESHGGTVAFERPPSGGSEFVVRLPRRLAETQGQVPAATVEARRLEPVDYSVPASARVLEPVRPPGASTGTVLVAEDDPDLLEMITRLLSDEYTVIPAPDGETALELAKKHAPHLLVTDVQMPGMSGIELAERFRATSEDRLAPVVIMSAIGDLGTRLRGLDAGAIDYVVKPFDAKELRARVRAQFRMRELAMRLHHAEQLSALGTLSAGLAHELRNPANGIINAIAPLRRQLPATLISKEQPAGQLLEVVASCADQIAFLSRQLLSFRSKGELELRTSTVAELVRKSLTLAHGGMNGVEVRLALEFEGQIQCAPQLMVQVLTNLLDNAAQAAGGGWVEVASRADERTVSIEVCDSGKGVPMELRERVFEPFFTTKPPGVGTGLGLPLARDIVHRHGGTLAIRDRGHHSVFAIEIPRRPASPAS